MHFIGQIIKHVLRSIFSILVFLLLVGLAKMNRDINAYISFLNNEDWSVINPSQLDTWTNPFWLNKQVSGDIADILTEDILTGEQSSGLDVYDPALEADLNTVVDSSLSGSEADF